MSDLMSNRRSMRRIRWSRVAQRLCALSLGLSASIGVLELALRFGGSFPLQRNSLSGFHEPHPELGWVGIPGYSARFVQAEFDVVIETSTDGFRKAGHGVVPRASARRIVFLGDSFTWGWGVAQGEVFTDRLQERLGEGYDVRNLGVNAYGTGQQWLLLREAISRLQPDEVVVMFFDNDMEDNRDPKRGLRPFFEWRDGRLVGTEPTRERGFQSSVRAVFRRSHALSAIRFNANVLGERLKAARRGWNPSVSATGARTPSDVQAWRIVQGLLAEIQELCTARGSELRLVRIAPPHLLEREDGFAGPLEEIASGLGIPFLDLREPFRDRVRRDDERLYFPKDGHWNRAGHALAAELLAPTFAPPLARSGDADGAVVSRSR